VCVGHPAPVAPFLIRPGYTPLLRPYDPKRQGALPQPPPGIPGLVDFPALARIATRLGITLQQLDEQMSIEDVFDECEMQHYIHDIDQPPQGAPKG
jgi:hypothetical protein